MTAAGGTPQTTTVSAPFGTALQALVKDTNGNAMPEVQVTFTAPASGASATLSSASATTNVVASVTATANATAVSYSVTAAVGIADGDVRAHEFDRQPGSAWQ